MPTTILTERRRSAVQPAWNVRERCATAKELESAGDYEAAREALAGFWTGTDERPKVDGLQPDLQAELLLRVGALSGWLGSSKQIPDSQAFAKDLISQSIRAFEALGDQEKVAEAQADLAICYWREGAMDEARVWFQEALSRAGSSENKLRVMVNSTIVEISSNRLAEALALLDRAAPLVDHVQDVAARGRFHSQRGIVLMELGGAANLDRALIDNAAARIYFEEANHSRYFARVENNTGIIFLRLHRYEEALEHLDQARRTLIDLGDVGTVAQVDETRARVFLAQQRYVEAEKIAFSAAAALENGGEQSLLAEALETQGIALARLGRYQSALGILKRAADVAETAGDTESSGRAFLTILEELRNFLAPNEIGSFYHEADRRFGDQLSAELISRLRASARLVASNAADTKPKTPPVPVSFQQQVLRCESDLIRQALDEANGSVTRAAKLLSLTHQGLCYIINHRHQTLLAARAPIRVRRKSLIKKDKLRH
jgi:tetratricopeptide (TPR) repeat protein